MKTKASYRELVGYVCNTAFQSITKVISKHPKVAAVTGLALGVITGIGTALKVRSNRQAGQAEVTVKKQQQAAILVAVKKLEAEVKGLNKVLKEERGNYNSKTEKCFHPVYDQLDRTNEVAKDKFIFSLKSKTKKHRLKKYNEYFVAHELVQTKTLSIDEIHAGKSF